MGTRLITPPAVEPISLSDVKEDLRISHSDDDLKLGRYISAAREWLEQRTSTKIAAQTWELVIDEFPADEIKLPFGPVASITHIKYDNSEGVEITVAPLDYQLDNSSPDPWVFSVDGWPTDVLDAFNSVRVRFVAGYTDLTKVPKNLLQSIRLGVQELYDGEDLSRARNDLLLNHVRLFA